MLVPVPLRRPGGACPRLRWAPGTAGALLLALLALAASPSARAQVNTERLRSKKTDQGWHGFAEGAVTLQAGNTDLLLATLGARVELLRGVHSPFLQGSYALGEKNGDKFIHNGFLHARWTAMWHRRLGTELFSQIQFDDLLRLHYRFLAGAGLRLMIVQNDKLHLYLGSGYMVEYEDLNIEAGSAHPRTVLNHRWTSYLLLRIYLTSWLRVVATTYAQPCLDDFQDFRFLEDLSLVMEVKKWLALDFNVVFLYDSDPPQGVRFSDTRLITKLRVSW